MSDSGVGAGEHAARSHAGGPSEPAGEVPTGDARRTERGIVIVVAAALAVSLFSAGALFGSMTSGQAAAVAAALPAPDSSPEPSGPASSPAPAPTSVPAAAETVTEPATPEMIMPAPVQAAATPAVVDVGAPPVQLMVPDLGIDQGLIGLRVTPEGRMQVPESAADIGWWSDGPAPGSPGAALMVGHVDSKQGPGVFYHLSTMAEGAVVAVRGADGRTLRFLVTGKQVFPKDDFPDELVYRTEGKASLHLVTCGGTFDRETGHYRDNVVVFADLIEETPAPDSAPAAEPAPVADPASSPTGVSPEEKASADKMNAAIAEAISRATADPTGADAPAQVEEDGR